MVVRTLTAPVLLIAMATAAAASSSGTSATAKTSGSPNAKWNDSSRPPMASSIADTASTRDFAPAARTPSIPRAV